MIASGAAMRFLVSGLVAALAIVGQAGAQGPVEATPPPRAAAAPKPGDAFDYRTSYGRRLRMTLVAASGDRFEWELTDVTDAPSLVARITQDAEFRIVANEDAAGGVTRYDPHDCEKVVGICGYTVHHPDGSAGEEMRVNGVEGGVWNYSLWRETDGENRPVGIGEICYDAAGLSLRESWTDLQTADGYSLERIRPDGTLADCSEAVPPLE
jgi:hypothetical protein